MGFGAVVTIGDKFSRMSDPLGGSLVEIRIEMDLSKPTQFALRFEDDICDGNSKVVTAPELVGGTQLGIFVPNPEPGATGLLCLVTGPITEVNASSMLGGAGSWVEIRGTDRRIEMDRVEREGIWSDSAKAAAETIINAYKFKAKVGDTPIKYDDDKNTLNQRSSDLAFLEEVARRNNMELWISYDVESLPALAKLSPADSGIGSVTETFHLDHSPEVGPQGPGGLPSIPALVPQQNKVLSVNPPPGECATVNRFKVEIDFEKPTAARGFDTPPGDNPRIVEEIVSPKDPLARREVPKSLEGLRPPRNTTPPPSPTPERAQLLREAMVYEQSWFVTAEGSTTPRLAMFVPMPHQIVDVTNNGSGLSGAYQIMSATHVITANEHYVDFKARANGLAPESVLARGAA